MGTHVSINIYEVPTIDNDGGTLRLIPDETTWITIGCDDTPGLLRQLAAELLAGADLIDVESRQSRRYLADAAEQVAERRRANGEISPDGICWDCKVDNHLGHKSYNLGRCYGCSCLVEAAHDV